jgi:hypothetical protein
MHERAGFGRRAGRRMAQLVWHLGINASRLKQPSPWVLANLPSEKSHTVELCHGAFYYIFSNEGAAISLITIIPAKELYHEHH